MTHLFGDVPGLTPAWVVPGSRPSGGFHSHGLPHSWLVDVMENPISRWMMDDWGYPHDLGNLHLKIWISPPILGFRLISPATYVDLKCNEAVQRTNMKLARMNDMRNGGR